LGFDKFHKICKWNYDAFSIVILLEDSLKICYQNNYYITIVYLSLQY
jgi:hypothetical protein